MFVLRKITPDNVEINVSLGHSYSLIKEDTNEKEFKEMKEKHKWNGKIYAFIAYDDGKILPLSRLQKNYIMTERGDTFANITCRYEGVESKKVKD